MWFVHVHGCVLNVALIDARARQVDEIRLSLTFDDLPRMPARHEIDDFHDVFTLLLFLRQRTGATAT